MSRVGKRRKSSDTSSDTPDQKLLRTARSQFDAEMTRSGNQRTREEEDIAFYNGEQWPADVVSSRAGQEANGNLPPIPARPCLVINKQREPVRAVLNMERNSDLGFELVPADDFGGLSEPVGKLEIELREGLVRRIQRTSDAASARTWAFERAVIAGMGHYGVMTRYGEGITSDQEVYVEKFWDQSAVLLVNSFEPDGSDAEAAFVGLPQSYESYIAEYPDAEDGNRNQLADLTDADFGSFTKDYPLWFEVTDKGGRLVRVVRYWYYERESFEIAMFPDGTAMLKSDVPDTHGPKSDKNPNGYTTRRVIEKRVKMIKTDGYQILERIDWPGKYIPIIKVVGEQLQPVKGEMLAEGMVRPGRDAQRGSNYMISKGVEMVGLTPIPPLILDPESILGYEQWYYNATTRTLPFLPQRTRGDDGREYREAHRPNVDPNIQPVAVFIQLFNESIQSTMGVHDPSLGKVDPRLKSGKAIDATIAQDQHGTSNYMDNLGRSVHREAVIENDLLFPIYGRPGRIAKMINGQNESMPLIVGQPFVVQDGRPVPAQPGDPNAKTYTLTKDANFNVAIKVTKNYDLKRDQVAEFLAGLVESNPANMAIFGDLLFESLDVPNHAEMAERAKVMLAPPILEMLEAKKQGREPLPPQVQQQMAEGQQIIEHLTKTVQQLEQEKNADTVKQENENKRAKLKSDTDIRLKDMEIASKERLAALDRETKITVAEEGAKSERMGLFYEERARLGVQGHEVATAAADAGHEDLLAQRQREHEAEMARMGVAGDAALADQSHGHALVQGQQAADLAPEPQAGV